jgi:hypothetical protein
MLSPAKLPDVRLFNGRRFLRESNGTKKECQNRGKKFAKMGHDYRVIKKDNAYSLYVSAAIRVSNSDFHQGKFRPMRRLR